MTYKHFGHTIHRWIGFCAIFVIASLLSACTYHHKGGLNSHYREFNAVQPKSNSVTVCHAYGCKMKTKVRMTREDVKKIAALMKKTKKANTPYEERRAIAYAVAWMEKRVGPITGTTHDRPGMEFNGPDDPTQQDCVDEATNTTSYLLFFKGQGLIKHHTIDTPFSKGNILRGLKYWPHWTAVLKETKTGQKYAVDSWGYKNGENPVVIEVEKWYIDDLENLPKPIV